MLLRVEIPLSTQDGQHVNHQWSPLLHGALMEVLPKEVAESMHAQGLKPLSQHIIKLRDGQAIWLVRSLNEKLSDTLDNTLLQSLPLEWNIRQKNTKLLIGKPKTIEKKTYRDLANQHFQAEKLVRQKRIHFQTTTTFKSDGQFCLFPSVSLLMNSLMQKWDAFSPDLGMNDPSVREHFAKYIQIRDYHLSSSSFSIDSAWIKGFFGEVNLNITGPEALCRLAHMLLDFARFSGVGVKTTLGMGGVDLV